MATRQRTRDYTMMSPGELGWRTIPRGRTTTVKATGAGGVGRFSVEIEVANYADLIRADDGTLRPDQVRRRTIRAIVDSGATKLVLPESLVKELGLPLGD